MFDLGQVELLWPQDRAGTCDSDPTDKGLGPDLVMLHRVDTDEGPCATETCLAVDCDGT